MGLGMGFCYGNYIEYILGLCMRTGVAVYIIHYLSVNKYEIKAKWLGALESVVAFSILLSFLTILWAFWNYL